MIQYGWLAALKNRLKFMFDAINKHTQVSTLTVLFSDDLKLITDK